MKPQTVNTTMKKFGLKSKLIKTVLFAVPFVIVVMMMTGSLYFHDRVLVTDNGVTKEIMTSETEVCDILENGGYTLGEHDKVQYERVDDNTAYITIERAFDVSVTADKKTSVITTTGGTVKEMLEKAEIETGYYDELSHEPDEEVYAGMEIKVTRVRYDLTAKKREIPFSTEYVENSNMAIGTERVVTEGKAGTHLTFVKRKYKDDVCVKKEIVLEGVSKEPVKQVIERGTALNVPYAKMADPTALKLENGIPTNYTRIVSGKSTAYTAGCGALTASGRLAEIGTAAVNPNVIPYGSELYIVAQDGSRVYGYAIAADTGTGLMDGTVAIDLYFGNSAEHFDDSCDWGAVNVDIYVLSEGNG